MRSSRNCFFSSLEKFYKMITSMSSGLSLFILMLNSSYVKFGISNVPSKLCARTQVGRPAHTRKLGVRINVPSKNAFCTYTIHVNKNSDEFKYTVAQKKFYVHTYFNKLEGALGIRSS